MTVKKQQIIDWLDDLAQVFHDEQTMLTDLDREIGDADHGLNMNRGFQKVKEKLPTFIDKDIGAILKNTGMVLLSSIGGASGPLYGTFFMRAAASTAGKEELSLAEFSVMLEEGMAGIVHRGKAEIGDKTMVDTWSSIVSCLHENEVASIPDASAAALIAGERGMQGTTPMQARKGRASYLGERSIGHQDPGATSSYLMFKALCRQIVC